MIQIITGHTGKICWDITKPDGTPKKLLDVSKIHNIGWKHSIELFEGLQNTYKWFL
jgi:GDP-L-fucose synthase